MLLLVVHESRRARLASFTRRTLFTAENDRRVRAIAISQFFLTIQGCSPIALSRVSIVLFKLGTLITD